MIQPLGGIIYCLHFKICLIVQVSCLYLITVCLDVFKSVYAVKSTGSHSAGVKPLTLSVGPRPLPADGSVPCCCSSLQGPIQTHAHPPLQVSTVTPARRSPLTSLPVPCFVVLFLWEQGS